MTRTGSRTLQIILGVAGVLLLIAWIVSGHLITGIGALILLVALLGGGILYRTMGRPEQ